MRQTAIDFFTRKRCRLEGVLAVPEGVPGPFPAVVVCHPHPMLGGDMENPVVTAICNSAHDQGIASVRFNFRGVGASQGEFTNGDEERDDLRAALKTLGAWPGMDRKRLALVGYSFGASVILGGLAHYKAARSLVLIAPPVASIRRSRISKDSRAKLFVAGQEDRVAPSVAMQRILDGFRPPTSFFEVTGADHGLSGRQQVVAERVVGFLVETLGGGY